MILLGFFGGQEGDFKLPPNRRERSAKLVGDVGGKSSDLLEGLRKARGHAVEAIDQMVEFIARLARRNLYGQVGARDLLRGFGDGLDRLNRAAGEEPANDTGQEHDGNRQLKIA